MDKFNLKFKGEILPGHDPARVVKLFASSFHIADPERAEKFFSGEEITLRRNLPKDEAARIFVNLRQIGMVTFTEKIEEKIEEKIVEEVILSSEPEPVDSPESIDSPEPVDSPEPTSVRRKRQPGAPNFFALRLSDRAGAHDEEIERSTTFTKAPLIAAGIALLAFILVGARFWSQNQMDTATGLGGINIDARQQPVVQIADGLYWHDRAGIDTRVLDLFSTGLSPVLQFDFFGSGELLLLQGGHLNSNSELLAGLLGNSPQPLATLKHCDSHGMSCSELARTSKVIEFLVDRRTNTIILASAERDVLEKLDLNGNTLASRPMELTAPLHLNLQEGILYLSQGESDTITVLKPDDRDFGMELDNIALSVDGSSLSGHIFPGDFVYGNERWWVIMQSRDASTAGLYLFSSRWKFEREIPLPAASRPVELNRWSSKILVSDPDQQSIYRFDTAGREEKNFASESVIAALNDQQAALNLSQSLQALILVMLFGVAAGMLALSILNTMREQIYTAPADDSEAGFDINSADIEWLAPAVDSDKKLRQIGYSLAGSAVVALVGSFLIELSIWAMLAISLILTGVGGLYFALQRACSCHLGILGDRLIVVDHTNTYRVGAGPKIQYLHNYVMIDDVIVYLGNRLVSQFANEPLHQRFQPLFTTGIKVDRATLRVKLIQRRHPMLLGISGLALTVLSAAVLIAMTQ